MSEDSKFGMKYLVVDEDEEVTFTNEPKRVLANILAELCDSSGNDCKGYGVAVYRLEKRYAYQPPNPVPGSFKEVK